MNLSLGKWYKIYINRCEYENLYSDIHPMLQFPTTSPGYISHTREQHSQRGLTAWKYHTASMWGVGLAPGVHSAGSQLQPCHLQNGKGKNKQTQGHRIPSLLSLHPLVPSPNSTPQLVLCDLCRLLLPLPLQQIIYSYGVWYKDQKLQCSFISPTGVWPGQPLQPLLPPPLVS